MALKWIKRVVCWLLILAFLAVAAVAGINALVIFSTDDRILSAEDAGAISDVDCILVLGCYVIGNTTPSHMLLDRLNVGIALWQAGVAPKLLMSGDHGQTEYNEVVTMKRFAVEAGVPSQDVFMDHAGFSTYESIHRAKAIFGVERMVIVTQEYHLPRALYIADSLGIEAWGVSASLRSYGAQIKYDLRESLARTKDVFTSLFRPDPTYLGECIPINGNGDATNDENYERILQKRIRS